MATNTGRLGRVVSRPRILRQRDPFSLLTTQMASREAGLGLFGGSKEISKNVFTQGGMPKTRSKRSVRRLYQRDPYNLLTSDATFGSGRTVATFSPQFDQFTNNANKMYDPSKAPGGVREVSRFAATRRAEIPGNTRNRGKVFRPNRQTLFGGKTLRRR